MNGEGEVEQKYEQKTQESAAGDQASANLVSFIVVNLLQIKMGSVLNMRLVFVSVYTARHFNKPVFLDPFEPDFYMAKLGFAGLYIIKHF